MRDPYQGQGPRTYDDLERLLSSFRQGTAHAHDEESNVVTSHWMPAVDIREEPGRFTILADVPGVEPQAIEVSMAEGTLSIKGERAEPASEGAEPRRSERPRGSFHRRFTLPETADADAITARTSHGVLTVDIPKRTQPSPRRIAVGS